MTEIWVLGATGRGGRGIAKELVVAGADVVLVGRDPDRVEALAGSLTPTGSGGVRTLVASGRSKVVELITREAPSVVVNTIGPFTETSLPIARACLAVGSHYVDLANELGPVRNLLGLHEAARTAEVTMVTGAGFGVLATEALVVALRADRMPAVRARVAAMPAVEALGPAVLASSVDAIATGGWRYRDGHLVRTRLGSDVERFPLPDGRAVNAIGVPTGEVEAAQRASGAGDVIAYCSEVPSGRIIRALLPAVSAILSRERIRIGLQRLISRLRLTPPATSGDSSWAYPGWSGPTAVNEKPGCTPARDTSSPPGSPPGSPPDCCQGRIATVPTPRRPCSAPRSRATPAPRSSTTSPTRPHGDHAATADPGRLGRGAGRLALPAAGT